MNRIQKHVRHSVRKLGKSVKFLSTDHWILITPLILSGCMGIYDNSFECPPGKGVGCKSISEVNQLTNKGLGRSCSSLRELPTPSEEAVQPQIWYALEEA